MVLEKLNPTLRDPKRGIDDFRTDFRVGYSAGMFRMRVDKDLKIRHTWSLKTKSSILSSIIGYKECSQFSSRHPTYSLVRELGMIPYAQFGTSARIAIDKDLNDK